MPVLEAEIDCYPEGLWAGDLSKRDESDDALWWCLHTKPRQEKALARELLEARVSFYLPQVSYEGRTPRGRRFESLLPLFPGYVFLRGGDDDRIHALHSRRLVRILDVVDQEALHQDLQRIHRFLGSGLRVSLELRVSPGMKVQIRSGPLAGLEGTVIRRGNGDHFVAMVRFLSHGASVELQDWQVEPIAGR